MIQSCHFGLCLSLSSLTGYCHISVSLSFTLGGCPPSEFLSCLVPISLVSYFWCPITLKLTQPLTFWRPRLLLARLSSNTLSGQRRPRISDRPGSTPSPHPRGVGIICTSSSGLCVGGDRIQGFTRAKEAHYPLSHIPKLLSLSLRVSSVFQFSCQGFLPPEIACV